MGIIKTNESPRNLFKNQENHENVRNPCKNSESHENSRNLSGDT